MKAQGKRKPTEFAMHTKYSSKGFPVSGLRDQGCQLPVFSLESGTETAQSTYHLSQNGKSEYDPSYSCNARKNNYFLNLYIYDVY